MKLTVIGGAGVRTPRLIPSLVHRADRLDLQEIWLMDIQSEKLELIGGLCHALAEKYHAPFRLILTTNAHAALKDANHVITSIRPGFEQGRATDELIAFNHGILGQETTGAVGFAMAMRSLPAILQYARLTAEIAAPGAWLYNFTNPAGLVAQGLYDAGIERVIGICDSANGAQRAVSHHLNLSPERVFHEVYGLNHLSWTRSVRIDPDPDGNGGEEVLPSLLNEEGFIRSTHMTIFDAGLRDWQQTFLNEYLHYYYHRDEALKALLMKSETRGEQIVRLTGELLRRLKIINADQSQDALKVYQEIMTQRETTYMSHARHEVEMQPHAIDEEGYAEVALGCIEAIETNTPHFTGLNVPNNGAIAGMRDDDIVEVSCWVDGSGVRPIAIGEIPEHQYLLMRTVKHYERLAVQAILSHSRKLAVEALTVHPLVGSYPLAQSLVDEFLTAHRETIGTWG